MTSGGNVVSFLEGSAFAKAASSHLSDQPTQLRPHQWAFEPTARLARLPSVRLDFIHFSLT